MSHRARKRFGQHFLVDGRVIENIISAIAPAPGEVLFEIGPGRAALTGPLARSGAELYVVEIDRELAAQLRASGNGYTVLNEDALKVNFPELAGGREYRLVGNLPYNISTPLLFHVLKQSPPPRDMHFMLQSEVVDRLVAIPGNRTYGRLTVMCRNRCEVARLFGVPAAAFQPRPRVDSAFVRLKPRARPLVPESLAGAFAAVVNQAFSMRRKTLRNSLRGLVDPEAMRSVGIDPGMRAEQLSVEAFGKLAAVSAGAG